MWGHLSEPGPPLPINCFYWSQFVNPQAPPTKFSTTFSQPTRGFAPKFSKLSRNNLVLSSTHMGWKFQKTTAQKASTSQKGPAQLPGNEENKACIPKNLIEVLSGLPWSRLPGKQIHCELVALSYHPSDLIKKEKSPPTARRHLGVLDSRKEEQNSSGMLLKTSG